MSRGPWDLEKRVSALERAFAAEWRELRASARELGRLEQQQAEGGALAWGPGAEAEDNPVVVTDPFCGVGLRETLILHDLPAVAGAPSYGDCPLVWDGTEWVGCKVVNYPGAGACAAVSTPIEYHFRPEAGAPGDYRAFYRTLPHAGGCPVAGGCAGALTATSAATVGAPICGPPWRWDGTFNVTGATAPNLYPSPSTGLAHWKIENP